MPGFPTLHALALLQPSATERLEKIWQYVALGVREGLTVPQMLDVLGRLNMQVGRNDQAKSLLERALAINPNLTQVEETVEKLRRLLIERRKDTI